MESIEDRVTRLEIKQENIEEDVKDLKTTSMEHDRRLNNNDLVVQGIRNDVSTIKNIVTEVRDYQQTQKKEKEQELKEYKKTVIKWAIGVVLGIISGAIGLKNFM